MERRKRRHNCQSAKREALRLLVAVFGEDQALDRIISFVFRCRGFVQIAIALLVPPRSVGGTMAVSNRTSARQLSMMTSSSGA
jgi:hypothetical protein